MSANSGRTGQQEDLPGVDRLLALTDGVVAIALTLLVLELKVPSLGHVIPPTSAAALAAQLSDDTDQLLSYLISFYVIANFWLIHHRVFRQLTGQRESLAWWNFLFLFTISIMPFTSNLLGEYSENPLAVSIFALNLLLASLATQATLEIGRRRGLMTSGTDPRAAAGRMAECAGDHRGDPGVHRPGLGQHRCRQVLLAADRARAARGRSVSAEPGRAGRWPGGDAGGPSSAA